MKIYFFLVFAFISLNTTFCQNIADSSFFINITKYQKLVYNEKFEEAISLFNDTNYDSLNYINEFILTSIEYWENFVINEYWENSLNYKINNNLDNKLLSTINNTIVLSEKELDKNQNNSLALFILGSSYGYKGMYNLAKGETFSAIKNASKGLDALHLAFNIDSTLVDINYAFGIYNYNAGSANFFIRLLLPIFFESADKEKGIEYLEYAKNHGKLSVFQSTFTLAIISEKEGNYPQTIAFLEAILNDYPMSSPVNILLIQTYYNLGSFNKTLEAGKTFVELFKKKKNIPLEYLGYSYYLMALSANRLSKINEAREFFEKYLDIKKPRDFVENAKKMLLKIETNK